MKKFRYIIPALLITFATGNLAAQQEQERTSSNREKKEERSSELTVRAQAMNEQLTVLPDNVPWKRVVYRFIDLTEDKNTPLYYPPQPIGNQMNLFSVIFRMMAEGRIDVYDYVADYEDFSEQNKSNLKDILDRFYILYKEDPVPGNSKAVAIEIDNSDIPSEEVQGYYMKEIWYFDQQTSNYNFEIVALCPIIFRAGDVGEEVVRYPMFWVPYENIRPYISKNPVMTSNLNNAPILTLDDYFRKRMFKGEIYKVGNLKNVSLQKSVNDDPDSLKIERERIEEELATFAEAIWLGSTALKKADEETSTDGKKSNRQSATTDSRSRGSSSSSSSSKSPSSKAPKPPKASAGPKSGSSSVAPVNSVRRVR